MPAKMINIVILVALVFIARAYFGAAISEMPEAYRLSETCAWSPKAWARALGADERPVENQATRGAEWSCYHARGQKSRSPFINTILPRWPSASQRRTWEMTDEDRDPLHAEGPRALFVR